MAKPSTIKTALIKAVTGILLVAGVWAGFRSINAAPPEWQSGVNLLASAGLFLLFNLAAAARSTRTRLFWFTAGSILAWVSFFIWQHWITAAFSLFMLWSWSFWLARIIRGVAAKKWVAWVLLAGLALVSGSLPVTLDQIQGRFSEEEFFQAIRCLQLALLWGILCVTWFWAAGDRAKPAAPRRRLAVWGAVAGALALLVYGVAFMRAYMGSFYPAQAPAYPGMTASTPFSCGAGAPRAAAGTAEEIRSRLLANVSANPHNGVPELGMLALSLGEHPWAARFHDALMDEARQSLLTGPAGSVKFGQYEAALRAYYYPLVLTKYPGLFSPAEQKEALAWFGKINRRALTVEWVDWLYAAAFSKIPAGPYENQENGAGLLALLEAKALAAPDLGGQNRAYLDANRRGWLARFRNTDDALEYQPYWVTNAYFQWLYFKDQDPQNRINSFEWMAYQALPDGQPYGYNHPIKASLAGSLYLGALLTGRGDFLWLAGKQIDAMNADGLFIQAQPGAELDLPEGLSPQPPQSLSCLVYGDSGLPNQAGPLAPDKIILRDGWEDSSAYLLLNLRFTGWHRYKATNTLTILYQDSPVLLEPDQPGIIGWLPVGRSHVRDKRIPREALNGLVVERQGLSRVLYELTGDGGPWAQDPPFYASVEKFQTSAQGDEVITRLDDWHGWSQLRQIHHTRDGLTVVVDYLSSENGGNAAILWHVPPDAEGTAGHLSVRTGAQTFDIIILPAAIPGPGTASRLKPDGDTLMSASEIHLPRGGKTGVITLVLSGKWLGAKAAVENKDGNYSLHISKPGLEISYPLKPEFMH